MSTIESFLKGYRIFFVVVGLVSTGVSYSSPRALMLTKRATLPVPPGSPRAIVFSPDGKLLIIGGGLSSSLGRKGGLVVWDLEEQRVISSVKVRAKYEALSLTPDGETLIAMDEFRVDIWKLAPLKRVAKIRERRRFWGSMSLSPDGKTLALVSIDGSEIRLFDLKSRKKTRILQGYFGSVAFSPDGKLLAAGEGVNFIPVNNNWHVEGGEGHVYLWDTTSWQKRQWNDPETPHNICTRWAVENLVFSPDSKLLFSDAYHARIWSVDSQKLPVSLQWPDGHGATHAAAFSPDGKILATVAFEINLWDTASGSRLLARATQHENSRWCGWWAVAFSPDGTLLATDGGEDKHVTLWELSDFAQKLSQIAQDADVDAKDKDGWSALHNAAYYGYKDVAELLIAKNADVNAKDKDGWTPLHNAAHHGYKDVAGLLIAKAADVNAKTNRGWTPLHLAVRDCPIRLHRAASVGDKEMASLLITKGADVNARDDYGKTPLHHAANSVLDGSEDVAELLITKGADLNAKDIMGKTPLDVVPLSSTAMRKLLRRHSSQ